MLGCLMEKEVTTPDNYPLTLNSLRNACNQTTSRDPVVSYEEHEIERALAALRVRGLTRTDQNDAVGVNARRRGHDQRRVGSAGETPGARGSECLDQHHLQQAYRHLALGQEVVEPLARPELGPLEHGEGALPPEIPPVA